MARDAHADRTRVTAAGVPCGFGGCSTRLGVDVVRTLLLVGERTLPDPRAAVGDPPAPILPLSVAEVRPRDSLPIPRVATDGDS